MIIRLKISLLNGMTQMKSLRLRSNKISDISALKRLSKVETLDLGNNLIKDFSLLNGMTQMKSLRLGSNKISDISALKRLSKVETLDLSDNQISDIFLHSMG